MSWRKIVVKNVNYEYMLGESNAVIKYNGKKIVVNYSTLTGRSWSIIERGQHKKTTDGMITPKDVATYIENNL